MFWYVVAGVTYIAAATVEKGLLNWLVGPTWLVLVVWWGPELVDRVRRRAAIPTTDDQRDHGDHA